MLEHGEGTRASHTGGFGVVLRRLRERAGLTQEDLASRSGLSVKAVSALERGERKRPYPHTVRALAEALGLSEGDQAALQSAVPGRGTAAREAGATSFGTSEGSTSAVAPPASPTPLVGRESDLQAVREMLVSHGTRLLTLTGVGGWARRAWPRRRRARSPAVS